MRKSVIITTPFPKSADVARFLGVSPARAKELSKMVDEIIAERELKEQQKAEPGAASKPVASKRKQLAKNRSSAK